MICLAEVANSCTSLGFSHCCKTANCWLKRANHHLNLDPVLSPSTGLAGFRIVIVVTTPRHFLRSHASSFTSLFFIIHSLLVFSTFVLVFLYDRVPPFFTTTTTHQMKAEMVSIFLILEYFIAREQRFCQAMRKLYFFYY